MEGLNVTADVYRRTSQADDAYGGAVRTEPALYYNVRMRIGDLRSAEVQSELGIEAPRVLAGIIYPAGYDIREEDVIVPQAGHWSGKKLLVVGVQYSSLRPGNRNAHIEVTLSRFEFDRTRP